VTAWSDVGLVLAGSAGPLVITVVTLRHTRRIEAERDRAETIAKQGDLHARFLAAAAQVLADWADYVILQPDTFDEERSLDERRDTHYDELNHAVARIRLTATPQVATAAEEMLEELRNAQETARATERGTSTADAWREITQGFVDARTAFITAARTPTRNRLT
jgi:hypothetical protein